MAPVTFLPGLFVILQNQTADGKKEASSILKRDEDSNFISAHWADLHGLVQLTECRNAPEPKFIVPKRKNRMLTGTELTTLGELKMCR